LQEVNLKLWKPGKEIAIDELICPFEGRYKDKTTIPTKPTPIGFKIWVCAQRDFFLVWAWNIPGTKGGPVGVPQIGGSSKKSKEPIQLTKTQLVVPYLIQRLPKQKYHVTLDNLFTSHNLLLYLRSIDIAATGTCRDKSGVVYKLASIKKNDKGENKQPWGTLHKFPTKENHVLQCGWEDNAFVLLMTKLHCMMARLTQQGGEDVLNSNMPIALPKTIAGECRLSLDEYSSHSPPLSSLGTIHVQESFDCALARILCLTRRNALQSTPKVAFNFPPGALNTSTRPVVDFSPDNHNGQRRNKVCYGFVHLTACYRVSACCWHAFLLELC
jgi:hypothetical protein